MCEIDGIELTPVDAARDRVHYVSPAAALVLTLRDGQNAATEIPLLLQRRFDLPERPDGAIAAFLAQVVDEGPVEASPGPSDPA